MVEEPLTSDYLLVSVIQTVRSYTISALIASVILFIIPWFLNIFLLYYIGGVFFLSSVFAPIVTRFQRKQKISPKGKAVFISGCGSGFGYMLAQRLDDLGFVVFAGCRRPDAEGASELRKSGSNRMHVIPLDVTSDDSVREAAAYVEQNLKNNVLWAVVNNAGVSLGCEVHWTNTEIMKRVMEVNTFGVIRMAKAFLPQLKQSQGRVITISSAAGRYTFPGIVPYCISKCAAIGFCDGLRLEMYKWNIQVITIEPFFYRTSMNSEESNKKNMLRTWESAPKDVKDLYDADYFDNYLRENLNYAEKSVNRNLGEVVSLMEDVIMTLYPEKSYILGNIGDYIKLWLLQKLPKSLADVVIVQNMPNGRAARNSR